MEISQPRPKFEHSALEKDIQRLSKEVLEYKKSSGKEALPEREVLRSVIGSRVQAEQQVSEPPQTSNMLPQYLQQESSEIKLKVEELIDIAFHKGIDASVEEAKKYGPFVLDSFHDALTTKIYDELKARKLI